MFLAITSKMDTLLPTFCQRIQTVLEVFRGRVHPLIDGSLHLLDAGKTEEVYPEEASSAHRKAGNRSMRGMASKVGAELQPRPCTPTWPTSGVQQTNESCLVTESVFRSFSGLLFTRTFRRSLDKRIDCWWSSHCADRQLSNSFTVPKKNNRDFAGWCHCFGFKRRILTFTTPLLRKLCSVSDN